MKKLASSVLFVSALFSASSVSALTLDSSLTPLVNFSLPPGASTDPHSNSIFSQFTGLFDTTTAYTISSFSGHSDGSVLDFTMASERGAYATQNRFGVTDQNGVFREIFSGASNPGDVGTVTQSANDIFTLTLIDPYGNNFFSEQTKNADGMLHMFALKATAFGTLNIPAAAWSVDSPAFTIDISPGMVAIFTEDLIYGGDFDFNDLVTIGKQTANVVPEPVTCLLTALGTGVVLRKRRKVQDRA